MDYQAVTWSLIAVARMALNQGHGEDGPVISLLQITAARNSLSQICLPLSEQGDPIDYGADTTFTYFSQLMKRPGYTHYSMLHLSLSRTANTFGRAVMTSVSRKNSARYS